MEQIITVSYKCGCNEKTYSSLTSLKSHKKTKQHLAWENKNELKNLKIQLTHMNSIYFLS